eukprot:TRINITY_DN34265_c0_g1_i1.p1 TRINITY_DN34265_c0_g1~~TRINITY_DN34265_c0_g1_i1.p1  ORF type:complete len:225 (-),score=27.12 TRINITY_DN34265_c0_g1_i1:1225-1899(-)
MAWRVAHRFVRSVPSSFVLPRRVITSHLCVVRPSPVLLSAKVAVRTIDDASVTSPEPISARPEPESSPLVGSTANAPAGASVCGVAPTVQNPEATTAESGDAKIDADAQISLTDNAVKQIQRLRVRTGQTDHILRAEVKTGGCQGFEYHFDWVPRSSVDAAADVVFERDGVALVVDREKSLPVLAGCAVDYSIKLKASAFRVLNNPNASMACSCGRSFALSDFD